MIVNNGDTCISPQRQGQTITWGQIIFKNNMFLLIYSFAAIVPINYFVFVVPIQTHW